jgi:hypothetical protein
MHPKPPTILTLDVVTPAIQHLCIVLLKISRSIVVEAPFLGCFATLHTPYVLPLLDVLHLKLGKQRKVTVFYIFYVKRRISIFHTKNLYRNDTRKLCTKNVL